MKRTLSIFALIIAMLLPAASRAEALRPARGVTHMRLQMRDGSVIDVPMREVLEMRGMQLLTEPEVSVTLGADNRLSAVTSRYYHPAIESLEINGNGSAKDYAFLRRSMSGLRHLSLRPEGELSLPDSALYGLFGLRTLSLSADVPPEFNPSAFVGMQERGVRLIVPVGTAHLYAVTPWGKMFRIFEEGSQQEYTDNPVGPDLVSLTIGGFEPKIIDRDSGFILLQVPYGVDLTAMAEHMRLAAGCRAFVDDDECLPGSAHDYSTPRRLRLVTADGSETQFVVAVCFSDMPMVYVNTADRAPIDSRETYVSIDDLYVVDAEGFTVYEKAKIKGRGNSSWSLDKKSFTLKLNKKEKFLGMAKHKSFALVANHADKTMLRNSLAYEMGREVHNDMRWNPDDRFVQLVVNGEYFGLYEVVEMIKIDSKRVDIPNIEDCKDTTRAAEYGYLLEVNSRMDEDFNFMTDREVCFSLKDPDGADITPELCEYISGSVQRAEDALFADNFDDPESDNYYGRWLDVPSFIDWYLVNEIAKNVDAQFTSSCYMYYDPADGRLHMGPLWDFDRGYGNHRYEDIISVEGFHVTNASWFERLMSDPAFEKALKDRYAAVRDGLADYVERLLPERANALAEDAEINFKRWPILGTMVWPNPPGWQDRTTYQSEVDWLQDWLRRRLEWLDTRWIGHPAPPFRPEEAHEDLGNNHLH